MNVYCVICFALPGEWCRTKYLVHGQGEVTPVICRTHAARLAESQRLACSLDSTPEPLTLSLLPFERPAE